MSAVLNPPNAGWRIPKACQECRQRKIRCNGLNPRKKCQQTNTPCIYRDFLRRRKKKHEYQESRCDDQTRQVSPLLSQPSRQRSLSNMRGLPNSSVSATHMASPSCQMQLYYGPTSHFALMQHIYRDLVSNPTAHLELKDDVEEAGAGLDLFSFRRIFFGTPDTHDSRKAFGVEDASVNFLPYELAKSFLSSFLSTIYCTMPHFSKAFFEKGLQQLYNPTAGAHLDPLKQAIILLALATASLDTEYYAWGDILYNRVKIFLTSFDDIVNLQTIQVSLLMISRPGQYANFQIEQGRPNSAFLYLGSAARKAIAMGLHKDVPHNNSYSLETTEERRNTFWSLYLYETWFSFHLGRPSSLCLKDIAIEHTQDPFIRLLVDLCTTMSRSANEIYGQRHESLLQMWRIARSIADDLRTNEVQAQQTLGFGLDARIETGSLGVKQTIYITLYYHTILLTFRPFLIFRGHRQREMKMSDHQSSSGAAHRPAEMPSWVNEACNHALTAARKTIHHLREGSKVNDLVRQLRYNGYFQGSSAFTLIYDFLHDPSAAPVHLPWVYESLQTLSTMRAGDSIASTISATQTTLRKINASYEWIPYSIAADICPDHSEGIAAVPNVPGNMDGQSGVLDSLSNPSNLLLGPQPALLASQSNLTPHEAPDTDQFGGSSEDLSDFTQSEMGWNFDFSTMDLEAFFSVYQSADTNYPWTNVPEQ